MYNYNCTHVRECTPNTAYNCFVLIGSMELLNSIHSNIYTIYIYTSSHIELIMRYMFIMLFLIKSKFRLPLNLDFSLINLLVAKNKNYKIHYII